MVLAQSHRVTFGCVKVCIVCLCSSCQKLSGSLSHPTYGWFSSVIHGKRIGVQSRTYSLSTIVDAHLISWLLATWVSTCLVSQVDGDQGQQGYHSKSNPAAVSQSAGVLCAVQDFFFLVAFTERLKCESIFLV